VVGKAIAPSGASTGSEEAIVVDPYKYKEIEEKVSKALVGMSVFDQVSIDEKLREIDGYAVFTTKLNSFRRFKLFLNLLGSLLGSYIHDFCKVIKSVATP